MIYYLNFSSSYLSEVAQWILTQDLKDNIVILPNFLACNRLQQLITKFAKKPLLFPKMLSFFDEINVFFSLEKRISLIKILYYEFNYPIVHSVEYSKTLEKIFKFIVEERIDIYNLPLQHQLSYSLILRCWKIYKDTPALIDKKVNHYLKQKLLIIGIASKNKITKSFLKNAIKLDNIKIILPPLNKNKYSVNSCLYSYVLNQNMHLLTSKQSATNNNVRYLTFNNILEESVFIVSEIQKKLKEQKGIILVICKSQFLVKLCKNNLSLHNINYKCNEKFFKNTIVSFILLIADLCCSKFNVNKLLNLLKHPLLLCSYVNLLEKIIYGLDIDIDDISELILNNQLLKKWWNDFLKKISVFQDIIDKSDSLELFKLIKFNLLSAEKLSPSIWNNSESNDISFNWSKLLKSAEHFGKINPKDYFPFLRTLIKDFNYNVPSENSNVIISDIETGWIIDADYVILADYNENDYLKNKNTANHIEDINYDIHSYYFETILHRENLLITKSHENTSKFLLKLSNHFQEVSYNYSLYNYEHSDYVKNNKFPKNISATNIDLLMKNPYGFYAKNILNLRPLFENSFGNVVHKIFDKYNKSYTKSSPDIFEIAWEEMKNNKLWWIQSQDMLKAFVDFDNKRRKCVDRVYTEVKGSIKLGKLLVTAIADRIEISNDNKIYILDFKTGTIPSSNDVLRGLFPQLIIETLILLKGKFNRIIYKKLPIEIIFVKISTLSPYIIEKKIKVIDLEKHFYYLNSFLNFYIENKKYRYEYPLKIPSYDLYQHLNRNILL